MPSPVYFADTRAGNRENLFAKLSRLLEAAALIAVSHFKCHELTGFGGAFKNLGMGCSSRAEKLEQHSNVAPRVAEKFCTVCAEKAIQIQWSEEAGLVMKKMAEYATGALHGKGGKTLFVNFVTQVSPARPGQRQRAGRRQVPRRPSRDRRGDTACPRRKTQPRQPQLPAGAAGTEKPEGVVKS